MVSRISDGRRAGGREYGIARCQATLSKASMGISACISIERYQQNSTSIERWWGNENENHRHRKWRASWRWRLKKRGKIKAKINGELKRGAANGQITRIAHATRQCRLNGGGGGWIEGKDGNQVRQTTTLGDALSSVLQDSAKQAKISMTK